ncbi:hypothetical protein [Paenibacillus sp. DMB5]|nr:hypothetical protein [Paenibacillus sp. DMB5]KUP23954.1 hypothetical protein AWJ19_10235 [Paenibacillus sp. DMB5]
MNAKLLTGLGAFILTLGIGSAVYATGVDSDISKGDVSSKQEVAQQETYFHHMANMNDTMNDEVMTDMMSNTDMSEMMKQPGMDEMMNGLDMEK